jgi:hypothetical protein
MSASGSEVLASRSPWDRTAQRECLGWRVHENELGRVNVISGA